MTGRWDDSPDEASAEHSGAPRPYSPASAFAAPRTYSVTDARPGLMAPAYAPPASIPTRPDGAAWAPPNAAAPVRRSARVARVAMGLAVGGAVLSVVPLLSLLSGPLLLAGFITAIVALASRRQGAKGVAASALGVCVVAWIASVVFAAFSGFGGPTDTDVDDPVIEEPYVSAGTVLPLVDSAVGPDEYDASAWWFVAVFHTPSSHRGAPYLDLTIEALDDTGAVIDRSTEYIEGPDGRIAVAGAFYGLDGRDVSSIAVRTGAPTDLPAEDAPGAFTVGALDASSQDGRTSVSGVLTSSFASAQSYVRVVVVARGPDGTILDVTTTWLEDVPPGDQGALVEAQFFRAHPPGTTYEAYVSR